MPHKNEALSVGSARSGGATQRPLEVPQVGASHERIQDRLQEPLSQVALSGSQKEVRVVCARKQQAGDTISSTEQARVYRHLGLSEASL